MMFKVLYLQRLVFGYKNINLLQYALFEESQLKRDSNDI